jgi:hypothetical protein
MRRILAKYNEAQDIIKNTEKEKVIAREKIIEKIKICKKEIIQNKIQEDLLNRMKDDYLSRTNYNDYNNNNNTEIKEIYENIYAKIFDIQKEQKELKEKYDDLLYLIK